MPSKCSASTALTKKAPSRLAQCASCDTLIGRLCTCSSGATPVSPDCRNGSIKRTFQIRSGRRGMARSIITWICAARWTVRRHCTHGKGHLNSEWPQNGSRLGAGRGTHWNIIIRRLSGRRQDTRADGDCAGLGVKIR